MGDWYTWALGPDYATYPKTNRTLNDAIIALLVPWVLHFLVDLFFSTATNFYARLKPPKRNETMPSRISFAQNAVCIIVSIGLFVCYAFGVNELMQTPEKRWKGRSDLVEWGLLYHITYSFYEEVLYLYYGKPFEMHLHHLLVIYNFVLVMSTGHVQFWGAWDGTVEITNVPLSLMTMQQQLGESVHPLIGVTLFLFFLIFRVINLAGWLYAYYIDVPNSDWDNAPALLMYSILPTTIFLWVLSSIWFSKITKGLIKVVSKMMKGGGEKKSE
jgi:hypothetical protein